MKLCTVCGVVTSRPGSRCTGHARQSNRSRHNALYSTRAWQRLSGRVLLGIRAYRPRRSMSTCWTPADVTRETLRARSGELGVV